MQRSKPEIGLNGQHNPLLGSGKITLCEECGEPWDPTHHSEDEEMSEEYGCQWSTMKKSKPPPLPKMMTEAEVDWLLGITVTDLISGVHCLCGELLDEQKKCPKHG